MYYQKKEYEKAYEYLLKYVTVHDTLTTRSNREKTEELKIKYDLANKETENEILKKNLEVINLQRQVWLYSFIFAIVVILLITFFLVSNIRMSKKLKTMNRDLRLATDEAEMNEKQILLINKMLRHDLMNNLSVVISALKLYKHNNNQNYLDEATKKCFSGIELIKNLHGMEREKIDSAHRHSVQVEEVVQKIIAANPNLNITCEGSSSALADDSLESVFTNLIHNAVTHGEATEVRIKILEINAICEISVYNNGKPIEEKILDKIFDEKFSYGEHAKTGMGLYLVKQNIQRYGGSIYVENAEPKGVTFFINLKKS